MNHDSSELPYIERLNLVGLDPLEDRRILALALFYGSYFTTGLIPRGSCRTFGSPGIDAAPVSYSVPNIGRIMSIYIFFLG